MTKAQAIEAYLNKIKSLSINTHKGKAKETCDICGKPSSNPLCIKVTVSRVAKKKGESDEQSFSE